MVENYTRFEKTRILSARALQLALGAPLLIESEEIDPIELAKQEFREDALPITVKRRGV